MDIEITHVRLATSQEWDEIWNYCDYATYFHSREWSEIWRDYTEGNLQPDAKLVSFSDGKQALLPLSSRKLYKGLIKGYLSSPAGTFGGWLSNDELTTSHAQLLSQYLINLENIQWRFNPYDPLLTQFSVPNAKEDITDVLNLRNGFEAIYQKWTKGHSSAARKARKASIYIKKAQDLQEWQVYYQLYEDSLKRWGVKQTSFYRWSLFNLMFIRQSSNIQLWLAIYEDQIIAGALCFYSKTHVVYWHGSALSDYFKFRPVNLLMYEIIYDACQHDYHWFDFNPSSGHEGVKAFKRSFGTQELSSSVLFAQSSNKILLDKFRCFLNYK
jgi:lipid II:glycine glycyltransferase (peptidoglycan interpeptide bridge formation enzyme)